MNTQTNVILSISTSPFVIQFIQTVRGVLYARYGKIKKKNMADLCFCVLFLLNCALNSHRL